MPTAERIHVITPEGEIQRWDIHKYTLDVTDQILESVSAGVIRKARMVLPAPGLAYGPVNLAVGSEGLMWWTIPVMAIQLRAPFKLLTGGVLTPDFAGRENVLKLTWPVPKPIRVVLLVSTYQHQSNNPIPVSDKVYLVALDKDGRTFRMPLANLHNTCQVCLGSFANHEASQFDCIRGVLAQFENSQWNKDLNDRHPAEAIAKFFRFKPTNDGFETLPIEGEWTALCQKIAGIADLNNIVI